MQFLVLPNPAPFCTVQKGFKYSKRTRRQWYLLHRNLQPICKRRLTDLTVSPNSSKFTYSLEAELISIIILFKNQALTIPNVTFWSVESWASNNIVSLHSKLLWNKESDTVFLLSMCSEKMDNTWHPQKKNLSDTWQLIGEQLTKGEHYEMHNNEAYNFINFVFNLWCA